MRGLIRRHKMIRSLKKGSECLAENAIVKWDGKKWVVVDLQCDVWFKGQEVYKIGGNPVYEEAGGES